MEDIADKGKMTIALLVTIQCLMRLLNLISQQEESSLVKCELYKVKCAQRQLKTKTLVFTRKLETTGILQHSDLASETGT